MSSAPNPWRAIAIVAIAFAFFSMSPFTVSKQPDGVGGNNINAKLAEIKAQLDEIQRVVGWPVDKFIDCVEGRLVGDDGVVVDPSVCTQHHPVGTNVTFCISQGRGIELAAGMDAEMYIQTEGGAKWDIAALGKVGGVVEIPLFVPAPIPIPLPTEASISGSAGLGRGLDICIEVPLEAIQEDQTRLTGLLKGVNADPLIGAFDRSKFQRRLLRLIRFAERRCFPACDLPVQQAIPGAILPGPTAVTADVRNVVGTDDEFDVLDDAVERFMAGGFQPPSGPFGLLKDPIIADLRSSLELPDLLSRFLDDPEAVFAAVPNPFVEHVTCDTFGLGGVISQRFPHIADKCAKLANLPRFDVTSTAFQTVHDIREFVTELPDEVIFGVADILPDLKPEKLPTPRPEGPICTVFPRLCR